MQIMHGLYSAKGHPRRLYSPLCNPEQAWNTTSASQETSRWTRERCQAQRHPRVPKLGAALLFSAIAGWSASRCSDAKSAWATSASVKLAGEGAPDSDERRKEEKTRLAPQPLSCEHCCFPRTRRRRGTVRLSSTRPPRPVLLPSRPLCWQQIVASHTAACVWPGDLAVLETTPPAGLLLLLLAGLVLPPADAVEARQPAAGEGRWRWQRRTQRVRAVTCEAEELRARCGETISLITHLAPKREHPPGQSLRRSSCHPGQSPVTNGRRCR